MVNKQKQGFTIIEVVLVLAIAGLIFLIVFLALPALQRSQRDTQRKNDIGRLISSVQSYQGNNRGNLPSDLGGTGSTPILGTNSTYLPAAEFADPSGGAYTLGAQDTGAPMSLQPTNVTTGDLGWRRGVDCQNVNKGARTVSIVVTLENGGVYCQNN